MTEFIVGGLLLMLLGTGLGTKLVELIFIGIIICMFGGGMVLMVRVVGYMALKAAGAA